MRVERETIGFFRVNISRATSKTMNKKNNKIISNTWKESYKQKRRNFFSFGIKWKEPPCRYFFFSQRAQGPTRLVDRATGPTDAKLFTEVSGAGAGESAVLGFFYSGERLEFADKRSEKN